MGRIIEGTLEETLGPVTLEATAVQYSQLPDDHPVHQKIGRVVTICAQIEGVLDRIVWSLWDIDYAEGHRQHTGGLIGPMSRIRAIKDGRAEQLGRDPPSLPVDPGYEVLFVWLRGNIQTCFDARNRLLHDMWYVDEDGKLHQAGGGKRLPFAFREIPDERFADAMRDLQECLAKATELWILVEREAGSRRAARSADNQISAEAPPTATD